MENEKLFLRSIKFNEDTNLDEGFKIFLKEYLKTRSDPLSPLNEKDKESLITIIKDSLKNAVLEAKRDPNNPVNKVVRKSLNSAIYAGLGAAGFGFMALGSMIAPVLAIITGICLHNYHKKNLSISNDKAFYYYKDTIEWLDNKIEKEEDEKVKRNLFALKAKYKANLGKLKEPSNKDD